MNIDANNAGVGMSGDAVIRDLQFTYTKAQLEQAVKTYPAYQPKSGDLFTVCYFDGDKGYLDGETFFCVHTDTDGRALAHRVGKPAQTDDPEWSFSPTFFKFTKVTL